MHTKLIKKNKGWRSLDSVCLELHKLLTASHRKQICLRKWMVCGNPFPAPKNIVWLYILLPTASAQAHKWILLSFFLSFPTSPSLPRTHTLSTPAVAWYFPAPQSMHELATVAPVVVEYLPASQLVQTLDPAIYVHTLSQTTLCKFLHLNISR